MKAAQRAGLKRILAAPNICNLCMSKTKLTKKDLKTMVKISIQHFCLHVNGNMKLTFWYDK